MQKDLYMGVLNMKNAVKSILKRMLTVLLAVVIIPSSARTIEAAEQSETLYGTSNTWTGTYFSVSGYYLGLSQVMDLSKWNDIEVSSNSGENQKSIKKITLNHSSKGYEYRATVSTSPASTTDEDHTTYTFTGDVTSVTFTSNSEGAEVTSVIVYYDDGSTSTYSVALSGGANATASGSTSQTVTAGQAMTTVTYTASTNYHFDEFPDIKNNGVKAARTDSTTVTVSGNPTGDVEITVPGAVADSVAVTGVSISPTSKSVSKNEVFAITATVSPENATNKKVKWSVLGSGITLYSDQDCNTQMTLNSETTDTTVYAKAGTGYVMATVTVTSAENANLTADCDVESGMTPITTKITLIYDANGGTPGGNWPEGNTVKVDSGAGIDFSSFWTSIDEGLLVKAPTGLVCEGITITDADGSTTYAYGDNTGTYKFQKDSIIKFNWIEDKFYVSSGDGGTWKKGSTTTLDFTFKRSVLNNSTYDCFTGIEVDGNPVERNPENYADSDGSVNINLKPAYLETLTEGEHTLTAIFTDNKTASAKFTITKESSGGGSSSSDTVYKIPRTGID